jgi:hypothetical protein
MTGIPAEASSAAAEAYALSRAAVAIAWHDGSGQGRNAAERELLAENLAAPPSEGASDARP